MPPFLTPGDGRNRTQGTDLPSWWVEKVAAAALRGFDEKKSWPLASSFVILKGIQATGNLYFSDAAKGNKGQENVLSMHVSVPDQFGLVAPCDLQ